MWPSDVWLQFYFFTPVKIQDFFSYWASKALSFWFSFFIFSSSSFKFSVCFSRNAARNAIWFSLILRASLERFAATLFFLRLCQYFSSLQSSGTKIYEEKTNNYKIQSNLLMFKHMYVYKNKRQGSKLRPVLDSDYLDQSRICYFKASPCSVTLRPVQILWFSGQSKICDF